MANWNLPTVTSTKVGVLTELASKDVDAATLFKDAPTNQPEGSIRYLRASDKFQESLSSVWTDKILSIAGGGTGGASASAVRSNIGLGTMAVQNASAVAITGGSVNSVTMSAPVITSGSYSGSVVSSAVTISGGSIVGITTLAVTPTSRIYLDGGDDTYIYETSANVLRLRAGGVDNLTIDAKGFGYPSGGTVTQVTNKSTAVTLNSPTGEITTHAESIGDGLIFSFTLNNTFIDASSFVLIQYKSNSPLGSYLVWVDNIAAGSIAIIVKNISGGPLSEALVLKFMVLKAATS